tara:strand:- start:1523 stop:2062 length:540 start_codon:yes stop_codon:yes gene_type:complete
MQFLKIISIFFVSIFLSLSAYAAGSKSTSSDTFEGTGGRDELSYLNVKNSNFKKGKDAIKQAKKYLKKGKKEKSIKRFNDAIKYLITANKNYPDNPDILNLLGFSYRNVEDFIMAEIYYKQGLEIDQYHIGINEYLGKLYVQTNRPDLANERLQVLNNCNCEEFDELKEAIAGTKKSKY